MRRGVPALRVPQWGLGAVVRAVLIPDTLPIDKELNRFAAETKRQVYGVRQHTAAWPASVTGHVDSREEVDSRLGGIAASVTKRLEADAEAEADRTASEALRDSPSRVDITEVRTRTHHLGWSATTRRPGADLSVSFEEGARPIHRTSSSMGFS